MKIVKDPGTRNIVPTVTCLGEVLIDFVAETTGALHSVSKFRKYPGGAPANVAVGLARLGIHCGFIGKIGDDAFGDFLQKTLQDNKVNTSGLTRTQQAPTALAFVTQSSAGEPDFHFYRHPCADILLTKADLPITWLQGTRFLHVGSVSLTQDPSRQATIHAVKVAKAHSATVSFDPNLRLDLWDKGIDDCYRMIHTLLKETDIFLPSMEELLLIMDTNDLEEAASKVKELVA